MVLPGPNEGSFSLNEIQTEFGGSNPISMNEYYRGGLYVGSNNLNVPTSGAISFSNFRYAHSYKIELGNTNPRYGSAGGQYPPFGFTSWTGVQNSSSDDAFLNIPFQFNFYINGTAYNSVNVGSNTYLTFGSGSTAYSNLSASNPPFPKIMLGAADNSYQRLSYFSKSYYTMIRYEGTAATSGTVGSPNIVYEITFYPNSVFPTRTTFNHIEVRVGNHSRTTGTTLIGNASTAYLTWTTAANNSFVLYSTNFNGTSWTRLNGHYVNQWQDY
jgi:hypothetical protein